MCDADLPPGAPSVWGSWGVTATVVLDPRNAPIGVRDAGEATLRQVIDEWNALADSAVALRFGGRDDVVFGAADGVVAVSWMALDGGLAATFVQPGRFAEIVDADVALSPDQLWSVDGSVPGGVDLATVLRHELGHVVGLRHAAGTATASAVVPGSTMDGCLRYGERRPIDASAAADAATRYPNRRPVVVDRCPGTDGPTLVAFQRRRALALPLAAVDTDGNVVVLAVGRDERLHGRVRSWATGRWSPWASFDIPVATPGPTVVTSRSGGSTSGVVAGWVDPSGSVTVGAVHVVAAAGRGRTAGLELRDRVTVPGLVAVDRPALTPGPRGGWELFARAGDGVLHHTEQTRAAGPWRPWRPVGGPPVGVGPVAGDGLVVATGADGLTTLVSRRASGRPHGWTRLSTGSGSTPGAPTYGP